MKILNRIRESHYAKSDLSLLLRKAGQEKLEELILKKAEAVQPEYSEKINKKVGNKAAINQFINSISALAISLVAGVLAEKGIDLDPETRNGIVILLFTGLSTLIARVRKRIQNRKAYKEA